MNTTAFFNQNLQWQGRGKGHCRRGAVPPARGVSRIRGRGAGKRLLLSAAGAPGNLGHVDVNPVDNFIHLVGDLL